MVAPTETGQRIARLTPLADVLARIDATVAPFKSYRISPKDALLREVVLAADIVAPKDWPGSTIALIDGYAVDSATTLDASSYAPVPLATPHRVAVGEKLPPGADAVAPVDAVQTNGEVAEILMPIAAGADALPAGGDMAAGTVLRRAGEYLRKSDIALLEAVGIKSIHARMPHVRIVQARDDDDILAATVFTISDWIQRLGGLITRADERFEQALTAGNTEAIVVIGGTGVGPQDHSVRTLARLGRVEVHGVGLTPGETTAFGVIENRPVLMIPGRLDAAVAAFATLGIHLIARLTGAKSIDRGETLTLSRKVTSTIGLAEFIPLSRDGMTATPLGAGYLPMQALARADGWLLVPPDSEGYPAGASVRMQRWP
jgi:molybdopterin biosynthesis enzyme